MPVSYVRLAQLHRQLLCMLEHMYLGESLQRAHDAVWLQKPRCLLALQMSMLSLVELLCLTQVTSIHHDATARWADGW